MLNVFNHFLFAIFLIGSYLHIIQINKKKKSWIIELIILYIINII